MSESDLWLAENRRQLRTIAGNSWVIGICLVLLVLIECAGLAAR